MSHRPDDFTTQDLEKLELFRSVDLKPIESQLRTCPTRRFKSGDVLIQADESNDNLLLLLSGRASVRLGSADNPPLAYVDAGESVGELSLIDSQPASAFVVAESEMRVLMVDEELLWMLVNSSHAVSSNLLFTLAKRMRYGIDLINQDREKIKEFQFHATVDGLTGLFNRYWLDRMLPRQMDRSRTSGEPFSLLMIDIDHFKQYNDSHGHPAGDRAICTVASTVQDNVRPGDMAARYGGEEFVVLLPNSPLEGAKVVAERLREAAQGADITHPKGALPSVTISLGIAEMTGAPTPDEFLSVTDAALYRAKHEGRNRIST